MARALIRHPKLLIFDEATSVLDSLTEEMITETVRQISGRKEHITILIAHRLSTVRRANCILVLKDGQSVERGNHQELLARGNVYAHLHEVQFGTRTGRGSP